MLHPSYKEMIDQLNETATEESVQIASRYSVVIAAAKRARQINAGSEPLVECGAKEKNLSIAVKELYAGKIHVIEEGEDSEEENDPALTFDVPDEEVEEEQE